jgi:HAD superfamily hydrolase (TIGR01509 family)
MASDDSRPDASPAVLFDVDGTLVDSNYLHVHAWQRAFVTENLPVEAWRIHRCIGMDGAALVKTLADDTDDDVRNRLTDRHSRYYQETASMLRPLPGARELLHRIADLRLQVVLATSAPEDELALLREVLDCDDIVSEVTSSGDVETAKPHPDLVRIALRRAGVTPDRAVFVGDAVWDAEAARRAGVTCIGVLSGGVSRGELHIAGAVEVFENAAQLLDQLDQTPIAALMAHH